MLPGSFLYEKEPGYEARLSWAVAIWLVHTAHNQELDVGLGIYHYSCVLTHNTQSMQCQIANPTNLETERPLTVTVHLGNQVEEIGAIRIREPLNLLVILIPVFSGVIILIVAIFVVTLVLMQRCQKRTKRTKFSAVQHLNQWASCILCWIYDIL